MADVEARIRELERRLVAQDRRIQALELDRSTGQKVRAGGAAGNAERSRVAAERAHRLGPMAAALGWRDSGRRLSDRVLLDLIRNAAPDADGSIPSLATVRRSVIATLGPSRSDSAWDAAGRLAARLAHEKIARGNVDFIPKGANEKSRRALTVGAQVP